MIPESCCGVHNFSALLANVFLIRIPLMYFLNVRFQYKFAFQVARAVRAFDSFSYFVNLHVSLHVQYHFGADFANRVINFFVPLRVVLQHFYFVGEDSVALRTSDALASVNDVLIAMPRHVSFEHHFVLANETAAVALTFMFLGSSFPLHSVTLVQMCLQGVVTAALVLASVAKELTFVVLVKLRVDIHCSLSWRFLAAGFANNTWMHLIVVRVELVGGFELFLAFFAFELGTIIYVTYSDVLVKQLNSF